MPALNAHVVELRTRDADRTQQAILRAAMAEFADNGLGGARIDAIAERAGVNKRLIYYYFEQQGRAVPRGARADLRRHPHGRAGAAARERLDPVEAVRRLVAFTWQYYLAHPEFLTLLNSENLHRAAPPEAVEAHPRDELAADPDARRRAASAASSAGLFRGGVDPVQLYISIAGLCVLLPVEQPDAVDDLRPRPDVAARRWPSACRTSPRW